jgi:hypothetical protein
MTEKAVINVDEKKGVVSFYFYYYQQQLHPRVLFCVRLTISNIRG